MDAFLSKTGSINVTELYDIFYLLIHSFNYLFIRLFIYLFICYDLLHHIKKYIRKKSR